jgi:predicted DNA-binding protein with PD1-like motif
MMHNPHDPVRRVRQPGPALAPRALVVPAAGRSFRGTLSPGRSLVSALHEMLGDRSAALTLEAGSFGPFDYVKPALSTDGAHAAFYSAVFSPPGLTRIEHLRVTFGRREGAAWLHGHGFWHEADGTRSGGHVMPHETIIAAPTEVVGWLLDEADFLAEPDPETNFTLFGPTATTSSLPANSLAIRLRPNQDICHALEDICGLNGIAAARIEGGVASIIGAHFDDGAVVENFATEMFIRQGEICDGVAVLDVALVDYTGALHEGRLRRGANPVLMTAELVVVPTL